LLKFVISHPAVTCVIPATTIDRRSARLKELSSCERPYHRYRAPLHECHRHR
jgi:hypothetical protein